MKIIDFGLSKILLPHKKTNDAFGTLIYAAPEILYTDNYDYSIDVWSLGVITYYLLIGKYPFDDDSNDKLWKKICYD